MGSVHFAVVDEREIIERNEVLFLVRTPPMLNCPACGHWPSAMFVRKPNSALFAIVFRMQHFEMRPQ